jgi:uncharacterized protein (DUF4213/DUF364 family)
MTSEKWRIYDELLASLPSGGVVKNIWRGRHWLLLESSPGGFGLGQNVSGDETFPVDGHIGRPLAEVAGLLKSWNFNEAAVGLAALNSVCNRPPAEPAGQPEGDAFQVFMAGVKDRRVAVIGRFPYLEKLKPQCRSLVVLERNPGPEDLPDSAAEYLLPDQEVVFITATTLINKTLPRLLELCRGARVGLVGPSTPLTPLLFEHGLSALSGLRVADPAAVAEAVGQSRSCVSLFAEGVTKVNLAA